ncbi:MAG: 3-deoxy-D-manno-octulosonic acid transferase [Planctomycetes bacterium]|nr:3-deoxy-D-manno-octulosonic acid transferase [Planctomycetota bacterium]
MPWILNLVYLLLLVAVSPVLFYRCLFRKKYRTGWSEKLLGRLPLRESDRPCVWFHAVSVGEVLLLKPIVRELLARRPDCQIVISTTTSTGHDVARKHFPEHTVCYFPLDFSWAVRRAIQRVRPSVIALVELELWPNFILAADRAGVPLVLVNGRISEHSYRGYRRLRPLIRFVLSRFTWLAVQSQTYAERLLNLGAPPSRTLVTGSVKFDGIQSDRQNAKTEELRRAFGLRDHETIFIAGSTHAPEEEIALDSWLAVRARHPELRFILVPRHQERFEEVAQMVQRRGLPLLRRSHCPVTASAPRKAHKLHDADSTPPVLLLDTLGELSGCWGLADIAFVGGSLTRRGGQNMIEPAAYGAAILFGPNTQNFRDVVDLLLSHRAARVVSDGCELTRTLQTLLDDRSQAKTMGRIARELVLSQQGATVKTVELLTRVLPPSPNTAGQRAA